MKNRNKFIRNLAKIEYGNAIFCEKLADVALSENRTELASLLVKHGKEENKHGLMLASLADGQNHFSRTGTGRWVKILRSGENIVKNLITTSSHPKVLQWESKKYPGEQLTGTLESFDGMSYRYLSARLLFKNVAASDYSWKDQLAFMYVLEEEVSCLYQELMNTQDTSLSAIASLITEDEFNHANYLKMALGRFTPFPQELIDKWHDRVRLAKWGLIVDGIRFLMQSM